MGGEFFAYSKYFLLFFFFFPFYNILSVCLVQGTPQDWEKQTKRGLNTQEIHNFILKKKER